MRVARLTGPQRFELVDAEPPVPQDGQVLVRIQRLSVCGSDLRTYDRVFPEEEYPLELGRPCHECAGVIEESRVEGYSAGQRVIVLPLPQHGLAEYLVEWPSRIVPLPQNGDLATLLMCQPVGTVLYSCQRIGSVLGKRVAILGQGAVGLAFTHFLAAQGARQVIVTDLLPYRLEAAKRWGATHTIDAAREDVPNAVAEITGGEMADVVVEAAGRPETANQVFQVIRKQGLAVLFGLPLHEDVFPFSYDLMMSKLPTILVTVGSRTDDPAIYVRQCVDLVTQGRLDPSLLITHRLPFHDIQTAYDMYSQKKDSVIKVVVEM